LDSLPLPVRGFPGLFLFYFLCTLMHLFAL